MRFGRNHSAHPNEDQPPALKKEGLAKFPITEASYGAITGDTGKSVNVQQTKDRTETPPRDRSFRVSFRGHEGTAGVGQPLPTCYLQSREWDKGKCFFCIGNSKIKAQSTPLTSHGREFDACPIICGWRTRSKARRIHRTRKIKNKKRTGKW